MLIRRVFLSASAGTGIALIRAPSFAEQIDGWPTKPIRVVFPTGPGGPSDLFRMYGDYMRDVFGQPFIYENRPGASGSIGVMDVVLTG